MTADTRKIKEHYNRISGYYQSLWSNHIHHGYYKKGNESVEEATHQLLELLVDRMDINPESAVLDVGCGLGGTSRYVAEHYGCEVTGITISHEQVRLAREAASEMKNRPQFLLKDAHRVEYTSEFDAVFAIEMIAHLDKRPSFFKRVHRAMKPGRRWGIAAWIKQEGLTSEQEKNIIKPIEEGMIVELPTTGEYFNNITQNEFDLLYFEDISDEVSQTWDITLDIIKNPRLWSLAKEFGTDFIKFLKSFRAMKKGYQTGCLKYVVMVLEK